MFQMLGACSYQGVRKPPLVDFSVWTSLMHTFLWEMVPSRFSITKRCLGNICWIEMTLIIVARMILMRFQIPLNMIQKQKIQGKYCKIPREGARVHQYIKERRK
jgi:hypothetical protein